jgi:hypothetical protein
MPITHKYIIRAQELHREKIMRLSAAEVLMNPTVPEPLKYHTMLTQAGYHLVTVPLPPGADASQPGRWLNDTVGADNFLLQASIDWHNGTRNRYLVWFEDPQLAAMCALRWA